MLPCFSLEQCHLQPLPSPGTTLPARQGPFNGDFPGGGLVVKTLSSISVDRSSIPGPGTEIPYASQPQKTKTKNLNIKQKQHCNKFNKDCKNGLYEKKSLKKSMKLKADSLRR